MKHTTEEIKLKDGRVVMLKSPELSDAEALIKYIKQTAYDTPFLMSEPEENNFTIEDEEAFIGSRLYSEDSIFISAFEGERVVANCHISSMGGKIRLRHRCSLGIAILKDYWGCGLGSILMERLVAFAENMSYEQIELEVIAGNERAIGLYKKFGFTEYGRRPRDLKYKDDTYADSVLMVKHLCFPAGQSQS